MSDVSVQVQPPTVPSCVVARPGRGRSIEVGNVHTALAVCVRVSDVVTYEGVFVISPPNQLFMLFTFLCLPALGLLMYSAQMLLCY